MSTPYISEIRMFAFQWPPVDWALCNGSILEISQQQVLYSLLGNMYGGSTNDTFALPDLRGRTPVNKGDGYIQGYFGGQENVTLTTAQMPQHTHEVASVTAAGNSAYFTNARFSMGIDVRTSTPAAVYTPVGSSVPQNARMISNTGGSNGNTMPHNNMQPSLVLSFCIALDGNYPPRN